MKKMAMGQETTVFGFGTFFPLPMWCFIHVPFLNLTPSSGIAREECVVAVSMLLLLCCRFGVQIAGGSTAKVCRKICSFPE